MLRTEYIRPVHEILAGHAAERPERIAFVDDVRTITYADLAATTARLAGHLQGIGVERGDRVLLYLDNRVEVAESYLAVPRAGAVAVCVNPASPVAEVEHVLADSGARVVVTDAAHLGVVRELAVGADLLAVVVVADDEPGANAGAGPDGRGRADGEIRYADLLATPAAEDPRDCLDLDDTAWMLYTSGTTGRPKGVYLTQRGCLWVVAACWAPVGIGPDDVLLSPLPLFHSYALVLCVLGVAAVGASERILPRFSVDDVAQRLTGGPEGDVTVMPGVPTMFHYMVDRLDVLDAPGLRMCISAGAILAAAVNERFEKAFSVPLLDGYGITETSTMVTMNWPTGERVMGSCGLPIPGLTVRLVDPATQRDVLPGEEGEIWVQGPNVTPGYHHLPDATAAAIVDGWYRTGDLARRDEHGYLRISGRTKELIIRGGENIYPAEVEDALLALDTVADAAVVGVPHEHLGEVPVAFVVPRGPGALDHDSVLAGAGQRLSSFKVPARLVEVETIPRTGSGKILRFRLRDEMASLTNER
ncbi:acyl-CoA synthetase (AMP-forming)/AMP-acid ligase II [Pseudonocardia sediminis]|uniref:Acyl-CoA synthetase (AMP-forming)/AMP-acid ligase II n=1 Tax=Pseudonocardia sediminis TaxID=1397368 RepID=A0A4Q7URP2_PSEST|nr:class I adenylate-forming enzyme family protein [Pseudonocardia sediminis]RZT83438.1 acyl-CoA synthetase (AMP-forming)/AMP-acid ligase II [Pseudonocardia sediminis]